MLTEKQFIYGVYINTLGPFFFTVILFAAAYFKKNHGSFHVALRSLSSINHLRIFWYATVPIFCIGLDLLVDIYRYEHSQIGFTLVGLLTSIIYRSWAIASLVKYWFVIQAHRKRMSSVGSIDASQMHENMQQTRGRSFLSDKDEA